MVHASVVGWLVMVLVVRVRVLNIVVHIGVANQPLVIALLRSTFLMG